MVLPGYRTTWVATPPPGAVASPVPAPTRPYSGPPSYAVPPRWGIPVLAWRRPESAVRADPVDRVRAMSRQACALLTTVAVLAVLAAGAEVWRYALLLASRTGPLSGATVGASDALVDWSGWLTMLVAVLAAVFAVSWANIARQAAELPPRPGWQLALLLVPVLNLVLPAVILAELERAAIGGDPAGRPRPSPLLWTWIASWVVGEVFAIVVRLLDLRTSVQARADGVVLHALTEVSAAVLAVLSVLVIRRITAHLDPAPARYERVLLVSDAPEPALRTVRPAGSPR